MAEYDIAGIGSWTVLAALGGWYIASKSEQMEENEGLALGAAVGLAFALGLHKNLVE